MGYAEDEIDAAAIQQIKNGTNLTQPSIIELEADEFLVSLIDSVDIVKFTKNGSSAISAGVKLARAYTGRELVARGADHSFFFSYDNWFIASTPITRGILQDAIEKTKVFHYNEIASLERLIHDHPSQFASIGLEPATTEELKTGYFHQVQTLGATIILFSC